MIAGEFKVNAEGYLHHVLGGRGNGAPVDFARVNPVMVEGSAMVVQEQASHPNAAMLFVEWLFSRQGLLVIEDVTAKGTAFPGSGTIQSKAIEGLEIAAITEEEQLRAIELNLFDRFAKVFGAGK